MRNYDWRRLHEGSGYIIATNEIITTVMIVEAKGSARANKAWREYAGPSIYCAPKEYLPESTVSVLEETGHKFLGSIGINPGSGREIFLYYRGDGLSLSAHKLQDHRLFGCCYFSGIDQGIPDYVDEDEAQRLRRAYNKNGVYLSVEHEGRAGDDLVVLLGKDAGKQLTIRRHVC